MDSRLSNQRLAIPNNVIEKAIRLHQYFNQKINLSHVSRATGMIFFYRFYEKKPDASPKEYALSAVACLHLATKVCETPKSFSFLLRQLEGAKGDDKSILQDIFQTLDGIPSRFSQENFIEINERLVQKEMEIIITLNFNFSVDLPYNLIGGYIERILKWHLNPESDKFSSFLNEIYQKCSMFLNDLQLIYMFYIYEPEILAIAAINMTFFYLKIPLISPSSHPWFLYLAPNLNPDRVDAVINDVKDFFIDKFRKNGKKEIELRKTDVSDEEMETWLNFPYLVFKNTPQCPPPPLTFLDDLVKDYDAFKHCELDHVPPFPPPPDLDYPIEPKPTKVKQIKEKVKNKEKSKKKEEPLKSSRNKGKRLLEKSYIDDYQYDDFDPRNYPPRRRIPSPEGTRINDERMYRSRRRYDYDYDDIMPPGMYDDMRPRYRVDERGPPPSRRERSPPINEKSKSKSNRRSASPRSSRGRSPPLRTASDRSRDRSPPPPRNLSDRSRDRSPLPRIPSDRSRDRSPPQIHSDRSRDRSPLPRIPSDRSRDRSPPQIHSDRSRDRSPPRNLSDRSRDRSPLPRIPSDRGRDRSPPPRIPSDRGRDRSPPRNPRDGDRSLSRLSRDRNRSPQPRPISDRSPPRSSRDRERERERYSPPPYYSDREWIEREREYAERERDQYMRSHSKSSRKSVKDSDKDKGKNRHSKSISPSKPKSKGR